MSTSGKYFTSIPKITYNPDSKKDDVLVFKHYNENEVILGKTMHEWCRFAVCHWHTFVYEGTDPFGWPTFKKPWNQAEDPMERHKERLRAAFEFFTKIGVKYWTFHDRDIAPEGNSLEETNKNLDEIVDLIEKLQNETGVKLLWASTSLYWNPRYANGAASNPDVHSFAYACSAVKKLLEVSKRLGGENFVFWGGRDGYQSLLNTDVKRELDHVVAYWKMAVQYKEKIGYKGQFLIEPKAREPMKDQYDYDARTVIGLLKSNNLDSYFKLNIEPNHTTLAGHCYEHDFLIASKYGLLGSLDINTGDSTVGWDTDQFLTDPKIATIVMHTIIKQNGLGAGGLNFDCKIRRESTEIEDLFSSHIAAMDLLAFGLKTAARIIQDGILDRMLRERYITFDNTELGKKVENGSATFEDCEEYVKQEGEPTIKSGKQEKFEQIFNSYFTN